MKRLIHIVVLAVFAFASTLSVDISKANFTIFQTFKPITVTSGCTDPVPVLANAFGFNQCTFFDSMQSSSTVDLQATNNAGFNWYTQNDLCTTYFTGTITGNTTLNVNSIQAQCAGAPSLAVGASVGQGGTQGVPAAGTTITACPGGTCGGTGAYTITPSQSNVGSTTMFSSFAQPSSSLSFSGAGLTISGAGGANGNQSIATAAGLNTGGGNGAYHGTTFIGAYARIYMAFDETKSVCTNLAACKWPAWWATSWPGTAFGGEYIEFDMLDALPAAGFVGRSSFLHDWNSGHGSVDSNFPGASACANAMVFDGTAFNTIDMLWVPTSQNGGVGLWASVLNADSCGGNALITGYISGTTLNVCSVLAGSVATGSSLGGNNVNASTVISGGSGSTWTVSISQTVGSSCVSPVTILVANGNVCTYYLNAATPCTSNTFVGAMSAAESGGSNGMQLIISAGCAGATLSTPPTAGQCDGAGAWPLKVKNIQVWQSSLGNKIIN